MSLPARLLDSIASAAVREGLADAVYTRLDTPIGTLLIVQGERGVVRVGFPEEPVDALLAQVAAGSARGSSPPTASSPPRATRSRPTSRATTSALDLPVDLVARALGLPPLGAGRRCARGRARPRRDLRRAGRAGRAPAGGARGRQRLRDQPGADHRPVPPRAARRAAASAATAAGRSASAGCSPTRARLRRGVRSPLRDRRPTRSRSARPAARRARPARRRSGRRRPGPR